MRVKMCNSVYENNQNITIHEQDTSTHFKPILHFYHCVKSFHIRSYSDQNNSEYGHFLRIPNTDTFYAVYTPLKTSENLFSQMFSRDIRIIKIDSKIVPLELNAILRILVSKEVEFHLD